MYSHCLFRNDNDSLEDAAQHKFEAIEKTLNFKPGMRVLDIGAGWAATTRFAGPRQIHVTSLTIASDSHQLHQDLITTNKFSNCQNYLKDFLEYEPNEPYDAIVAIGIIEHIPNYKRFVEKVYKCLKPGGRAYIDACASSEKYSMGDFIRSYIYPGTHTYLYLPDLIQELNFCGFKIANVSDETHDYSLTCHHWAKRFDANRDMIVKQWGEKVFRAFRLYLWGGSHATRQRTLQAYHVVAERTNNPGLKANLIKRFRIFLRSLV